MRARRTCDPAEGPQRHACRVNAAMGWSNSDRRGQRRAVARLGDRGVVAAEFALVAPVLVLIAAAIADFGLLATRSAALAGATRIGAEYARSYPLDTVGIQRAIQGAVESPPALNFQGGFTRSCECDDGSAISCVESCASSGRPGPNRLHIRIAASQAFNPLVPWPGFPASVTGVTELRLQ